MNSIFKHQNNDEILMLLASQRFLYRVSKRKSEIVTIIAFVMYLLGITKPIHNMQNNVSSIVLGASFVIMIMFSLFASRSKKLAASIQELIDRKLYDFRISKSLLGFSEETLKEKAINIKNKYHKYYEYQVSHDGYKRGVKNWYSVKQEHPKEVSILLCQKENIMWDASLRKNYAIFQMCMLILIISVLICVLRNETLGSVIVLLFSSISFIWNRAARMYQNIVCYYDKKNLRSILDDVLEKVRVNKTKDIMDSLQDIQNRIFETRKHSVMIPEWFYNISRKTDQKNSADIISEISNMLLKIDNSEATVIDAKCVDFNDEKTHI